MHMTNNARERANRAPTAYLRHFTENVDPPVQIFIEGMHDAYYKELQVLASGGELGVTADYGSVSTRLGRFAAQFDSSGFTDEISRARNRFMNRDQNVPLSEGGDSEVDEVNVLNALIGEDGYLLFKTTLEHALNRRADKLLASGGKSIEADESHVLRTRALVLFLIAHNNSYPRKLLPSDFYSDRYYGEDSEIEMQAFCDRLTAEGVLTYARQESDLVLAPEAQKETVRLLARSALGNELLLL